MFSLTKKINDFYVLNNVKVISIIRRNRIRSLGLGEGKESRTLENNGHRQEWDGSPMMGPWMTSWSAHGKVCPSQLTDGANLHHTCARDVAPRVHQSVPPVVRIKAHQVVCSRLVHWCALVCEMDVDNLRMREEVSTHHYKHFPAHQRQLVRCGKVEDFLAQNVLWNLNTMFSSAFILPTN